MNIRFIILFFAFVLCSGLTVYKTIDTELKLNQIHVLQSHNSYRMRSYAPLFKYWSSWKHPILKIALSKSLDYSNDETFDQQLSDYGLRGLEIDVYYDPTGGRYYNRKGNKLIKEPVESDIEALKKPGFKVMHVPDIDYMTHYYTFIDAIAAVKKWSDAHPNHIPIFIMIDAKDRNVTKYLKKKNATDVLPFTKNAVDSLDMEIEQVFGKNSNQLFTPDKLRGNYKNLNEAVLNNNWPSLTESRGKIIFILSGASTAKNAYLEGHYSLQNRLMFMYSAPGKPEAAFLKMDDPKEDFKKIQQLVKQGYIIRTRADAATKEARKNDYRRYKKALASGAQIIATDYYVADERHTTSKKWSNYQIQFPRKNVACVNPVNASGDTKNAVYFAE